MPDFSLIETMRYVPGEGIVRLPLHLQRLECSAEALGFAGHQNAGVELEDYLTAIDPASNGALRVRLELAPGGEIEITSAPFQLQTNDTVWHVAVAETRMNSADPLLRYKTTRRAVYDAARSEFSADEAQEVILLNEQGCLSEGTITNVFVDVGSGVLATPPLAAGCLDGVLRRSLLVQGKAVEQDLTLDDLDRAAVYVGNSLRGLIRAEIVLR